MSPKRFCGQVAAFTVCLLLLVGGFNIVVDPYLVFGSPLHAHLNASKPAVATRERLMKAYAAPRQRARTIILGSSRTDLGLDPGHAAWRRAPGPVYNLSLLSSDLGTQFHYLRHFVAAQPAGEPPQLVVLGLDFETFLFDPHRQGAATPAAPGAEPRLILNRDGSPNRQRTLQVMKDVFLSSLSLDVLADSVATVLSNQGAGDVSMAPDGHFLESMLEKAVVADGVNILFDHKNAQTVANYGNPRLLLSEQPGGPVREMGALQALITYTAAHGITLVLAIQPTHASNLDILAEIGYWDDYERWKRALADTVARARGTGAKVSLWDFGGYEAYATEALPDRTDRASRLKWFWDPVHYTAALGDLMVARMLGDSTGPGYGVLLTPANIDERIADVRQAKAAWRARQPGHVALGGRAAP